MKYFSLKSVNLALFDGDTIGSTKSITESISKRDNEVYGQSELKSAPVQRKFKIGTYCEDISVEKKETAAEKREAFEKLITSDFKDEFATRVQQIINRRFRNINRMKERLSQISPIVDMLMSKYNIEDGDIGRLIEVMKQEKECVNYTGFNINAEFQSQKLSINVQVPIRHSDEVVHGRDIKKERLYEKSDFF
jgi:hypothetical protein